MFAFLSLTKLRASKKDLQKKAETDLKPERIEICSTFNRHCAASIAMVFRISSVQFSFVLVRSGTFPLLSKPLHKKNQL